MLILSRLSARATPANTAFLASLLLSLIARMSSTINRDGMLYVDTARIFMESGFGAAREVFAWPFLPVLIATVSQLTGLGLENSGYFLNAMFMAGACALLVAAASRQFPDAAWAICLVTLAVPGLNEYRGELLREYGCWFFIMLTLWLALRWAERPRWISALAVQATLGAAALFRPEALALFPALIMWQLFDAPKNEKLHRILMIGGLPLLGLLLLLVLYSSGQLSTTSRLSGDLSRFSLAGFGAKAQALSAALIPYAREQARTILFFGSLAIIPLKFANKIGILIIPLLFLFARSDARSTIDRYSLFAWAFLAHVLVLAVFVLDLQFLAGRYVGLLLLLATPFAGVGLWLLMQRYPRWRISMIGLIVLLMLANTVSLSPRKTLFSDAGNWLATNAVKSSRVYIESGRAAYYAGWGYREVKQERSQLAQDIRQGKYDLVVLEVSRTEIAVSQWLSESGLQVIQQFSSPRGDLVVIAAPVKRLENGMPATGRTH